ncbi:hypothetical protein KAI78_06210 [bacterium]|nr:hypothetical protein [bacterium]
MKFKNVMRITLLILAFVFVTSTYGASIDMNIGARVQGMGGAFVGLADDIYAGYYNPAGLAQNMNKTEYTLMHQLMPGLSNYFVDYIAVMRSFKNLNSSIGLSWLRKSVQLSEGADEATSTFSENEYRLSFGLYLVPGKIALGLNLKGFSINSTVGSGSGFGMDIGVQWRYLFKKPLFLGITAQNIAAGVKDEKIDEIYKLGFAYKYHKVKGKFNGNFLIDISIKDDVNENEGMNFKFFTGTEYCVYDNLMIRIGINSGIQLNGGLGYTFKLKSRKIIKVDYNYSYGGEIVNWHRLSVGMLM